MKLREIERLRAAAVLMVMVVHWVIDPRDLPEIVRSSASGVDLFFVISGYVVTLSLVRLLPPFDADASFVGAWEGSRSALQAFYVRRFFRILPAALAVMLLHRVLAATLPDTFGSVASWWREAVAFFGGVYNYARVFHNDWNLGVYWSLAVEEHFYLVLPMLFVVFRTTNRRLAACLGIALACVVARHYAQGGGLPDGDLENYLKFASHLRFDSLMAGVALALVADRVPAPAILPRWLLRFFVLPAVLVLIAGLEEASPSFVRTHEMFVALWVLSGLLVAYAARDEGYVLAFPVVGRVLEWIGARSYALYLLHVSVMRVERALRKVWPEYGKLFPVESEWGSHWRSTLVRLVLVFLAAEILHRGVERPMMALGKRLLESRRAGVPLVMPRLRAAAIALGVAFVVFYFRHPLLLAVAPRNLARGTAVYVSSQEGGKPPPTALTNGQLEDRFGLYTTREKEPWAMIDLGHVSPIGSIRIYNREDGLQAEPLPLEVQISDDAEHFRTIASRDVIFTQEWPWRIRGSGERARYVRLRVPRETALCLSEVEIFAERWVAQVP